MVPRWSSEIPAPPASPPVIVGETVIVALQSGRVEARHISKGDKLIWHQEVPVDRPISADSDRVYVPSADAMQALDLKTGERLWRQETGRLTAPPLVHAGWVVTASAGGNLSTFRAADGSKVWEKNVGTIEFRSAIDGDFLFVPLLEGPMLCLNLQTGDEIWKFPVGGSPGEPTAVGGRVYLGAADKDFYALDAGNGELKWKHRIGAAPRGRAAIDEDNVYSVALDNVLWAFGRGRGGIKWRKGFKYRPAEGPSIIRGAIVVPGAIPTLSVFGSGGAELNNLTFPAPVLGISNVPGGEAPTLLAAVTGDLEHPWTLWLLEPSRDPPPLPLVELTVLPGVPIDIVLPQ